MPDNYGKGLGSSMFDLYGKGLHLSEPLSSEYIDRAFDVVERDFSVRPEYIIVHPDKAEMVRQYLRNPPKFTCRWKPDTFARRTWDKWRNRKA
jgi:hypothetical protein